MCGIVAMFAQGAVDAAALERGMVAIAHRGPDGAGRYLSPCGRVGLGHVRLGIIDLSGGSQPIANEDGRVHIVVNGEVYGHRGLRAELERDGHRFRTHTDSEVVLHLYERHGLDFARHLRGELAAVLWDENEQRLVAARDRFGIKPLHYARVGGDLYLASEVKALFALGVPGRWDLVSVAAFGTLFTSAHDRTFFSGVRQVPPGHVLVADAGGLSLTRYWDFDYPARPVSISRPTPADDQAAGAELVAALDEAVALRLQADVPVGAYLSGGLDSASIVALAAEHTSSLDAFTIVFDDDANEEGALAALVARHLGVRHHPLAVTSAALADNFSDSVWHSETLAINLHGVAKFLLSEAVRDVGLKVVITGEGADEVFAGYPHFLRDTELHDAEGQDAFAAIGERLGFVPGFLSARSGAARRLWTLLSEDMRQGHAGRVEERFLDALDLDGQVRGRDAVHQSLYLWGKSFLPSYLLAVLGDRMEMAHSVEGRLPYLDHHVFEAARALPIDQKIRGRITKYLLRHAMRERLPEAIWRRPKSPFLAPATTPARGAATSELVQDVLRGAVLAALPFIEPKRVHALLDELPALTGASRLELEPLLIGLTSACFLHERFRL